MNTIPMPRRVKNLVGKRFGKWLVTAYAGAVGVNKNVAWECLCDCGTVRVVRWPDLKYGKSVSCGCTFGRDKDLTDATIGDLAVLGSIDGWTGVRRAWLCLCKCGNYTVTLTNYLTSGQTVSCGCRKAGAAAKRCTTHGQARRGKETPEHKLWAQIKERCNNPNNPQFADYGGRGVVLHQMWADDFTLFFAAIGPRPSPGHSLDRIDNAKGYEPGNVRWATSVQQNNNRRSNVVYEYRGESRTLAEWTEVFGMTYGIVSMRIKRGWSFEKSITTPVKCPRVLKRVLRTERSIWQNMIYRCHHQNCPDYPKYGGRGIFVCERWRDSFEAFIDDMGFRPTCDHSVDRINNGGPYSPENCRWATRKEQANNRGTTILLTVGSETKSIQQWAEQIGVTAMAIRMRLKKGMTPEEAIQTPFTR